MRIGVAKPRPSPRAARSQDRAWTIVLASRADTEELGRRIGRSLAAGHVLALQGELGAGKTTFVRGLAAGLGTPTADVSSPTFVLMHEYRGRIPLVHVDLYRLRQASEVDAIGLLEQFDRDAVMAIEWADRFPALLPDDRLDIALAHRSPTTRTATVTARGPRSRQLLSRLQSSPAPAGSSASRRTRTPRRARKGARP